MTKKYVFELDTNNGVSMGTILDYPDNYTVEGTEAVWNAQSRSFYENGQWTIYDPLTVAGPTSVAVNQVFTVSATLPAGSPDTTVDITINHGTEVVQSGPPENVVNGMASGNFSFTTEGTYQLIFSSAHHGSAILEVVVHV